MAGAAIQAWRDQLAGWAIPERFTAAVADSPWRLNTAVFTRRTERYLSQPVGISYERAAQALATPGSVLDVGAGAGAACLPLAGRTTRLTVVDTSAGMLDELARLAAPLGLTPTPVVGRWPDVAEAVEPADVVLCHHVAYNVPDLDAFALALTAHALRRVVVELPSLHPLSPLNPLWTELHGLARPAGPTAHDALDVLREAGLRPTMQEWPRPPRPEYPSMAELVAVTRQRICLPPERDDELGAALLRLGVDPDHPRELPAPDDRLVTLWWDI
jgi:SAM-dependent methyltransferase